MSRSADNAASVRAYGRGRGAPDADDKYFCSEVVMLVVGDVFTTTYLTGIKTNPDHYLA